MKKLTLIAFLLVQAVHGWAQAGYFSGYVITNKNDTIKGLIKDRKYVSGVSSWQKIRFIDAGGKHFEYDPEEIKEYVRMGKPRYVTLTLGVESKKTFVEVSQEGTVLLYTYYRGTWGSAGNGIVIGPKKKPVKERIDFYAALQGLPVYSSNDANTRAECFLQVKGKPASLMQWRPRDYKKTAKVFFSDNEEIMKLLESDSLDEDDIFAIVKKYDQDKAAK